MAGTLFERGERKVTEEQITFVKRCIANNDMHAFYTCMDWEHLRDEVLRDDKNECQICKTKGKYTRAELVHHVNHVRRHPELALCKKYIADDGNEKRNLISVCKLCHETVCHPERMRKRKWALTVERW